MLELVVGCDAAGKMAELGDTAYYAAASQGNFILGGAGLAGAINITMLSEVHGDLWINPIGTGVTGVTEIAFAALKTVDGYVKIYQFGDDKVETVNLPKLEDVGGDFRIFWLEDLENVYLPEDFSCAENVIGTRCTHEG